MAERWSPHCLTTVQLVCDRVKETAFPARTNRDTSPLCRNLMDKCQGSEPRLLQPPGALAPPGAQCGRAQLQPAGIH